MEFIKYTYTTKCIANINKFLREICNQLPKNLLHKNVFTF